VFHPEHKDDSNITLNINLGEEFTGGDFRYGTHQSGFLCQKVGQGLMHCGHLPHSTMPITKGVRYNLIIWFKRQDHFPSLFKLPAEIITNHILPHLNWRDLIQFSLASHRALQFGELDGLWDRHYNDLKLQFNFIHIDPTLRGKLRFKDLYQEQQRYLSTPIVETRRDLIDEDRWRRSIEPPRSLWDRLMFWK
jgi:hypothetical protein